MQTSFLKATFVPLPITMDTTPQNNWLIYLLECRDDSLYCGITNNLEKRLKQHNGEIKGGAKYTRSHLPCKLVYKEKSASRSEASQREAIIKKMSKDEKQALIKRQGINQ